MLMISHLPQEFSFATFELVLCRRTGILDPRCGFLTWAPEVLKPGDYGVFVTPEGSDGGSAGKNPF